MADRNPTYDLGIIRLCRWTLRYALRRWLPLLAALLTMLLKVGLDVLKAPPGLLIVFLYSVAVDLPTIVSPTADRKKRERKRLVGFREWLMPRR